MRNAVWKNLLKYGIGLGALAWVLYSNWEPKPGLNASGIPTAEVVGGAYGAVSGTPGLRQLLQRPIHTTPLLLATLIAAVSLLITFLRWHVLVRAQGLPFSRRDAVRLGLIGYYFNTFLPGSVGGDIVKAVGIARDSERRTVAVATVLIDRAVGLWALIWFVALIGAAFWMAGNPVVLANPNLQTLVRTTVLIVAVTFGVWVVLGFLPQRRADRFARRLAGLPKVGGSLAELWRAAWLYRQRPKAVLVAMLMSMVGHTGWVLSFYFSAHVFDTPNPAESIASLDQHFLIVPVGMVIQALFPSPGGVGGGEAAYGWLYSLLGKPDVNGILGCLAQRIVSWLIGLTGAIVFTQLKKRLPQGPVELVPGPEEKKLLPIQEESEPPPDGAARTPVH